MTNFYAVVMQSSGMTPLAQWLVIGLTMAALMASMVVLRPVPAWKVRVVAGLAVALVLAVLASTASAVTIIECQYYLPSSLWWLFWSC